MGSTIEVNVGRADIFQKMCPESQDYWTAYYATREDWLIGRRGYSKDGERQITIGGSDAPVVAGVSSFKTRQELADELLGMEEPPDLSENENVKRGLLSEPLVRALFAVEHPNLKVYDGTGIVYYSKKYPWMSASLDGICIEPSTGKYFILELKSCLWSRQWQGDYAPDNYFVQVLHQMAVTGFDGVFLRPRVIGQRVTTERDYFFTREQCLEQMECLIEDERRFVEDLEKGNSPSVKIPTIL